MKHIDASGIRKAFDMARSMKDPINLSIGLPDFDVAGPGQGGGDRGDRARAQRVHRHPGHPRAAERSIQAAVDAEFGHADRQVLVTSGTSGALLLAMCCVVNPGEEVIIFDPYFVMYRHLATLAGGISVLVDTYPDFRIDAARSRPRSPRGPSASWSTRRSTRPAVVATRRRDARPGRALPTSATSS